MAYQIIIDPAAEAGIRALPPEVRPAFAEVMTVVGLVPWNGRPINERNPTGAVGLFVFADTGIVTYLILEREQRVDVLTVQWAG